MGTELFISEMSDFRTNDKGQAVHTVTEIETFRGETATIVLDALGLELSNCSSTGVDAMDMLEAKNQLLESLESRKFRLELNIKEVAKLKEELKVVSQKVEDYLGVKGIAEAVSKYWSEMTDEDRKLASPLNDMMKEDLALKSLMDDVNNVRSKLHGAEYDVNYYNIMETAVNDYIAFIDEQGLNDVKGYNERTFDVHLWY